ncbi:phage portal protein [Selenomonas ruminantium]|uniref:phage portal protein n=1 Tax=Selenomonas ruminantium TaxID=971 RepID=UPI0026EAE997|nr:phage portal protein [Selenomonas ruminantium]
MEIEAAKKLIDKYIQGHADFMARAAEGERYYRVQNDIIFRKPKHKDDTRQAENPLRNADNKIPFSFYQLLVNQKAGYMFTAPPLFDTGSEALNKAVAEALGDRYAQKVKELCINASNAGVAWLHYWIDEQKGFCYGVVPSFQIVPVWSRKLDKKLLAVLRVYKDFDENGDEWDIYEYWTDTACEAFRKRGADSFDDLTYCPMFTDFYTAGLTDAENRMIHNFGRVPFIPFFNNNIATRDLDAVKGLIDTYDKTFSGFVDDLEDIQEVILVLTNYGGQDMKQFLSDLKYYKSIQVDSAGDGDKSGVSTLNIDIPVEARDKLLELTRKAIFDTGQGIDPQQQGLDSTSGEAMKFLYALLEIKAGLMETEFKIGLAELVRAICRVHGQEPGQIVQTWTRTSIRNDAELASMCSDSVGVISKKTIIKNHPFVEDAEKELEQIEKERQAEMEAANIYGNDLLDDDKKGGDEDV